MKTTEILERLQKANYLPEQAKAIAEILEGHKEEQITREYLDTSLKEFSAAMDEKFRHIDNRFDKVYGEFDKVYGEFDKVYGKFDKVYGKFVHVYGEFENVNGKFEHVYGKLEHVENKFEKVYDKFDLQRSERQRDIAQAKFDLVKWIVAGIFINGAVAALLKYIG